jgi:hypothetical protein
MGAIFACHRPYHMQPPTKATGLPQSGGQGTQLTEGHAPAELACCVVSKHQGPLGCHKSFCGLKLPEISECVCALTPRTTIRALQFEYGLSVGRLLVH